MKYFLFSLLLCGLLACKTTQPLATVPQVDLNQYKGKWYEIASFPMRFQKDCNCTTATYTPTEKGYISVFNRCQNGRTGSIKKITGKAFPVKGGNNARLKVQFFPPFKAPYYIIYLDSAYQYAAVGAPDRNYLWLLSREPEMPDSTYQSINESVKKLGFDITKLVKTNQSCAKF